MAVKPSDSTLVRAKWLEADDTAHLIQERATPRVEKGKRYLELTFEWDEPVIAVPLDSLGK